MYVFLPSTVPALAALLDEGRLEGTPLTAFTADAGPDGDSEEAEYAAMYAAAEASLRMLAADPAAPRRRVVLAAEMPDRAIEHESRHGADVARVLLQGAVPYKRLKSVHVDDPDVAEDIAERPRTRIPTPPRSTNSCGSPSRRHATSSTRRPSRSLPGRGPPLWRRGPRPRVRVTGENPCDVGEPEAELFRRTSSGTVVGEEYRA